MAAVEVTISGVLYDKLSRTTRPCVLIGEASFTGLEIGGGPIPPGAGVPGVPSHPIYYPPGIWGPPDMPPGFWGGGMGPGVKPQPPFPGQPPQIWPGPRPSHPIVLPGDPSWPPGTQPPQVPGPDDPRPSHPIWVEPPPPDPPGSGKPPPPEGGWGYHPEYGWGYFPGGGGKPQPSPPA